MKSKGVYLSFIIAIAILSGCGDNLSTTEAMLAGRWECQSLDNPNGEDFYVYSIYKKDNRLYTVYDDNSLGERIENLTIELVSKDDNSISFKTLFTNITENTHTIVETISVEVFAQSPLVFNFISNCNKVD